MVDLSEALPLGVRDLGAVQDYELKAPAHEPREPLRETRRCNDDVCQPA